MRQPTSAELFLEANRLAARASDYRRGGMLATADVLAEKAQRIEAAAWRVEARAAEDAARRSGGGLVLS